MHNGHYGEFVNVRPFHSGDVVPVARRVRATLLRDAQRCSLLNPSFDTDEFASVLANLDEGAYVAEVDGRLVGHLIGTILESPEFGLSTWMSPDGVSFDDERVLEELYSVAAERWIRQGSLEHFAWVFDALDDTSAWHDLGFARAHRRGVMALRDWREPDWPEGYRPRLGGLEDLNLAIELDQVLDEGQRRGPSFAIFGDHATRPDDLRELLEDPDVRYYVVDADEVAVAQCATFALEARRGSFDRTVHLSALVVRPEHEGRGVARALVDHALKEAALEGARYAEVNWRVTNRRADRFWRRYGFTPTYVRLHRTIGSD